MTIQEFNQISGIKLNNTVAFDKINQFYMESRSNKYDYVGNLMKVFNEWVTKNTDNLKNISTEESFCYFVIHELDYYSNL